MGLMTSNDVHNLGRTLAGMRPDWSAQAILGVLWSIQRTRGQSTSFNTIYLAAGFAAQNPLNDNPGVIADDGPHWSAATQAMLIDGGRRWSNLHSRRVLQDAEDSHRNWDPEVGRKGAAAAREALEAIQRQPAG